MSCLFCKIIAKEINADCIYENDNLVVIRDIRPQAPTHLLIIPKQHIATINDADQTHQTLLGEMILVAKRMAQQEQLSEDGYRLVFNVNSRGGQEVFHIHLHLLGGRQMTWPPG